MTYLTHCTLLMAEYQLCRESTQFSKFNCELDLQNISCLSRQTYKENKRELEQCYEFIKMHSANWYSCDKIAAQFWYSLSVDLSEALNKMLHLFANIFMYKIYFHHRKYSTEVCQLIYHVPNLEVCQLMHQDHNKQALLTQEMVSQLDLISKAHPKHKADSCYILLKRYYANALFHMNMLNLIINENPGHDVSDWVNMIDVNVENFSRIYEILEPVMDILPRSKRCTCKAFFKEVNLCKDWLNKNKLEQVRLADNLALTQSCKY